MSLTPTVRNLLASVVVLGVLVAAVGAAIFSAYTSVSSNDGNTFTAGEINLTDNDSGSALFNVAGFTPGDTFVKCIQLNYASTGGVQSGLRLYGITSGNGLDQYLDLQIRRGTTPTQNGSGDCAGFTPDAADYNGEGAGVIFADTLRDFPDTYDDGTLDPLAAWGNGDSAVYEITMHVQNDNAAMGLGVTQNFQFEVRTL